MHDLFLLHLKICQAKPWERVGTKANFTKENMFRMSWEVTPKGGSSTHIGYIETPNFTRLELEMVEGYGLI